MFENIIVKSWKLSTFNFKIFFRDGIFVSANHILHCNHPRPQAQARAALTVALGQAVDLRRNSDAEAWSHSICIPP
jgi:hypothetical protein